MESSRPSRFQKLTILILGQKLEVVAHQLLQHTGQARDNPQIIQAGKKRTAFFSIFRPFFFDSRYSRKSKEISNFTLEFESLWILWNQKITFLRKSCFSTMGELSLTAKIHRVKFYSVILGFQ